MKTMTIELTTPEAIKLMAVCSATIEREEELLKVSSVNSSSHYREMLRNSIECIKELKSKIRNAVLSGRN